MGSIFGHFRGYEKENVAAQHLDNVFETISSLILRPGISMLPVHGGFKF